MMDKVVKKGFRKLSFFMALAMVLSLVFNVALMDVKVQAEESIPPKYDGKEFQTPVRDQKRSNLCWAYSTIAALEAAAVKQMDEDKDTLDFSEFHLAYFTFAGGHDDLGLTNDDTITITNGNYLANGANPQYPMAVLSGGVGPVRESVVSTDQIFESDGGVRADAYSIRLDESLRRGRNAYDVDLVYDMLINNNSYGTSNRDAVKKAIMECGAVVTSYYSSVYANYNKSADGSMCCYYQNKENKYDHGIAIVGWDDDFSKDNFSESNRPANNGAWLAKNSWNNNTIYTDNEGYFWISYEDYSFGVTNNTEPNHAYGYKLRPAGQYDYIYQYDGGLIHELNVAGMTTTDNIAYANIFTAQGDQTLEAINLHTNQGNANAFCTLKVFRDVENNPEGGTLAHTQSFTLPKNGFYTIKLDTPVDIDENQKFSVVVYTNNSTYIASDRDYKSDSFRAYNHTELNQSFVKNYYSDAWQDLDNENYYSGVDEDGSSLCIKALMNDQDPGTGTITHDFTYSASGADLIATCGKTGCNLTDNKLKLTITAENSTYNGNAHPGAIISGDTANWKTYTGLDVPTINYTGSNSYSSTTPPTNVGSYTATITVGEVSASCDFLIKKETNNGSGSGGSNSGGSGGGSSSGGSGGGSGNVTYPSANTGTSNTSATISSDASAKVNVQVSNNNVSLPAINTGTINSIISNSAATNGVKEVIIDLSKINTNITSVTITKDTANTIAKVLSQSENIKENLSFKLPNVTITLDSKAVSAVSEKAKTNEIKIVVENTATTKLNDSQQDAIASINKNEKSSVIQTFEAYVVSGTERISDFKGGMVRVSITNFKVPAGKNPKYYHVYSLSDKGVPVRRATWYENGALNFYVAGGTH